MEGPTPEDLRGTFHIGIGPQPQTETETVKDSALESSERRDPESKECTFHLCNKWTIRIVVQLCGLRTVYELCCDRDRCIHKSFTVDDRNNQVPRHLLLIASLDSAIVTNIITIFPSLPRQDDTTMEHRDPYVPWYLEGMAPMVPVQDKDSEF